MVSMLQVIDNPHQDIPLAAVLLGPMFSLTEDELAIIRMEIARQICMMPF